MMEIIYVNGKMAPCHGSRHQHCFQVKYTRDEPWGNFYDDIIGFDFEPGFIYKLLVSVDDQEGYPSPYIDDISLVTFTLEDILEKRPMTSNGGGGGCGCGL